MSTTLKRVPLDFKWPLKKVWKGYTNPHAPDSYQCKLCEGSGYSPFAHSIYEDWYGYRTFKPENTGSKPFLPTDEAVVSEVESKVSREFAFYDEEARTWQSRLPYALGMMYRSTLEEFESKWNVDVDREAFNTLIAAVQVEAIRMCNIYNSQMSYHLADEDVLALVEGGRLKELTHNFVQGQGWVRKEPVSVPSALQVNAWSLSGFGHDSLNMHMVIDARCQKANQPIHCAVCEGDGYIEEFESPEMKAKYEAWQEYEPPTGEGYQYWEAISEGAPVSPVFESKEELAQWLHKHRNHNNLSRYQWLKLLDEGGAGISMVMVSGQVISGEQATANGLLDTKQE